MKNILITIAVVLLVGCGESKESAPLAEAEPVAAAAKLEPANAKAPSISISKAVDSGNLEAVKQHIAAGANLNKKDVGGFSLLHWAADYGHKEIAELLIANGADVNAGRPFLDSSRPFLDSNNEIKIYYGETPLDMALSEENKETADLLRKHGAKTRDWLNADKSIHIAAGSGHVEAVKKHLAAGVDLNAKDNTGWTPLDHAKDHPETAGFLRKQGGKSGGEDSIHVAAWVGNIDAFKKHLADGVDLNAEDDNGWTLFSCAVNGGHKGIVELLITEGVDVNMKNSGCENLYSAVAEGHKEIIGLLIAAGVDVNCKDDDGMTPLHSAAQFASKEIVELLITKGADVNAKSDDGSTPLDYAEHETIALLRKHGGKTGEELKGGETVAEAAQPEPTTNEAQALDFWFVVISGHTGDVKQAIAEGADVNAKVGGGKTPLHGAASNGFKEIAELLIANGADVNAKDDYGGKTPLYDAIKDHKEIVELLLAKGADLNVKPEIGYPLLHEATRWGRTEVVELLIANGANVNEKTRGAGVTPLDTALFNKKEITALLRKHGGKTKKELEAAELGVSVERLPRISIHDAAGASGRKGNIEAVKQHLAAGTDVDARDRQDKTPLQHAAYWGHKEIAEELIAKGADVNAKDNAGKTTLDWAILGGKKESVELLIVNGVDVNAKSENGFTPLDLASLNKRTEPADLLRKNGGKHGTIHGAAAGGDTKAVKEFLSAGTEVTARDKYGRTPLHGVTTKEITELLIAKGADVNAKSKGETTPLHFATSRGHKEVAELLIAKGADVNAKDNRGRIPLNNAVRGGHKEVAELLIAAGADVNAKNNAGTTPLHWAARYDHKEIVELLIAAGADEDAKKLDGDTPLDWAIKNKRTEIADFLRKHGGKTGAELEAEGK